MVFRTLAREKYRVFDSNKVVGYRAQKSAVGNQITVSADPGWKLNRNMKTMHLYQAINNKFPPNASDRPEADVLPSQHLLIMYGPLPHRPSTMVSSMNAANPYTQVSPSPYLVLRNE